MDPAVFHTAVACFIFVFMEWVFFVTKPSFLSKTNWGEKFLLLLLGALILIILCYFVLVVLGLQYLILKKHKGGVILGITNIIPAIITSITALLMIDNFTYTLFKFGIITSQGIFRAIYAITFLLFLYFAFRLFSFLLTLEIRHQKFKFFFVVIIVVCQIFIIPKNEFTSPVKEQGSVPQLPNIILIGTDGLSADNMSVYGYERNTTPYIANFAKEALIVTNNFSNASNTTGSLISILTGKYPTQTGVLYPPDMLSGVDATHHLPGILRSIGYHTVELSVPYYADAFSLGIINGFDVVNGETAQKDTSIRLTELGFTTNESYFFSFSIDRILERLSHIFFIKDMINPYNIVTKNNNTIPDNEKVNTLVSLLTTGKDLPLFIHVHMMGTHGPKFYPEDRYFSSNQAQDQNSMIDFYDDSIINFDRMFGEIINTLKETGKLENTIVVLYSDHAMSYQINKRVPLIIRFPNGEYKEIEIQQGQNLDISPTILDYLRIQKPEWMSGFSLIAPNYKTKPVISVGTFHQLDMGTLGWVQDKEYFSPPFYQFDFINIIQCQKWYQLNLETFAWSSGKIENYENLCNENDLLPNSKISALMVERLKNDGFKFPEKSFISN